MKKLIAKIKQWWNRKPVRPKPCLHHFFLMEDMIDNVNIDEETISILQENCPKCGESEKFMMNKSKGQISLLATIIGVAGAMAIAIVGGFVAQTNITDTKIQTVRVESEQKIESVRKDVETIKTNTFLICGSLKIKCKE